MAKTSNKNIKKGNSVEKNKTKKDGKVNIKTYEKLTCLIVAIIILFLVFAVMKNAIFIPALLITIGLELFCIAYYYIDNKSKKSLVYALFEFGVFLVIVAIIYTIFKIV